MRQDARGERAEARHRDWAVPFTALKIGALIERGAEGVVHFGRLNGTIDVCCKVHSGGVDCRCWGTTSLQARA